MRTQTPFRGELVSALEHYRRFEVAADNVLNDLAEELGGKNIPRTILTAACGLATMALACMYWAAVGGMGLVP